ncbi:class I adenylate-forming enzyme family protein [Brevibacterium zhoupengii]|uniref:class I adenylate-forming enzyme family protein n=1 Tax=Brevibacterium zhoupengii TaxID=2898795 RepID=UPI001E4E90FE|nr:AMP-binding protein [Brevibacterium zhoupengii]
MQTSNTAAVPTRSKATTHADASTCEGWEAHAGRKVAEAALTSAFPVADLVGLPADRARSNPDGPCLSWPGGSCDNAEFASAVATTAHAMSARFRVGFGSVVGVLLCNARGVITTMFAAWSLGAVLNPIDPALDDDAVGFQLDDSGAVLLVGDTRAEVVADVNSLSFLSVDDDCYRGGAEPLSAVNVRDSDGSLIVYTSAATGPPKGCLLSHSNVSAMVWSILSGIDFDEDTRSLLVLPLFDGHSLLAGAVSPLMFGGSVHLLPEFDPTTFWDIVEEERPSYFSAGPAICSALESSNEPTVDATSLRFVFSGDAPMSIDAITRFEAKFDVPILVGYGRSECSAAATINRNDGTRRLGTVGTALPGITVAIRNPHGQHLPAGETGEVIISGQTVMRGFLGRPEATAEAIKDGWLHTGDLGFLDEDGYLTLVECSNSANERR